jgi:hypothetical protein
MRSYNNWFLFPVLCTNVRRVIYLGVTSFISPWWRHLLEVTDLFYYGLQRKRFCFVIATKKLFADRKALSCEILDCAQRF